MRLGPFLFGLLVVGLVGVLMVSPPFPAGARAASIPPMNVRLDPGPSAPSPISPNVPYLWASNGACGKSNTQFWGARFNDQDGGVGCFVFDDWYDTPSTGVHFTGFILSASSNGGNNRPITSISVSMATAAGSGIVYWTGDIAVPAVTPTSTAPFTIRANWTGRLGRPQKSPTTFTGRVFIGLITFCPAADPCAGPVP